MIRTATIDDVDALAAIHHAAWRAAYVGIVPDEHLSGLSIERHTARWRERWADADHAVLVAEQDDVVVGFVTFGPSRDEGRPCWGEVQALYVHPDNWGHGHGRRLMQGAEAQLRADGLQPVFLWVFEANHAAQRFYARLGYRLDGERRQLPLHDCRPWVVRYTKG